MPFFIAVCCSPWSFFCYFKLLLRLVPIRCGWGNWDKVRECILASPRFAFDYYLRSLSESALGKHCEQLMKSAEKYLQVGILCLFVTRRKAAFCPVTGDAQAV